MADNELSPELQQGQRNIEEILKSELKKQGITATYGVWWSNYPPTEWEIEVKTADGLTLYQKFSPNQLTGFQTDNKLKIQVYSKVAGLVGKFMKLTRAKNSTKSEDLK